jgi:hypothetical protein
MLYYDVRFHLHTRRVIKSDFPSFLPSHLKNQGETLTFKFKFTNKESQNLYLRHN